MTDISKCAGLAVDGTPCPMRESCWRFVAPPDPHWQSWAAFSLDGECMAYLPMTESEIADYEAR